jgi:hypothetical protein
MYTHIFQDRYVTAPIQSLGSAVGITTDYGLNDLEIGDSIYKICKVIVFYGLQVSSESYVLVFYIGTHLMMVRESRNM